LEQPNGESSSMNIVVPADEEAFSQIYRVRPVTDGTLDLSADGAWVSQAYAEHFGAKVGDVIVIDDGITKHEVPILGFYEFWLTFHEMVVGKGYFEKEFDSATPNAVLAQVEDGAFADLEAKLANVEHFDSLVDDAAMQKHDFDTFSSVSGAVVLIYLVLATLMAIVVLLNLNVMVIDEKKRELIVLMINGFSVKDARHYVSYDNIMLTALGIIAGLVLGCVMGSVTVASVEPVTGVFVKSIDGWAVVIGILGSAVLATIMALVALRRVNKLKLPDINKV
jgi:ABC-type antimicrobial peptide transport system permease subunit